MNSNASSRTNKPSGSQKKKKAPSQQHQQHNGPRPGGAGGKGKGKGKQPQSALAARTTARKIVTDRKCSAAEGEYSKALKFFDEGQYGKAFVALEDACRIYKTLPKYAMKMAATLMKLERYQDAIDMATFRISVRVSENTFEPRFLRATAFLKTGEYGYAAADLLNCRAERPGAPEIAAAIEELHALWDVDDEYFDRHPDEAEEDVVYTDQAACVANFDLDCASDTEESTHMGYAGKPCTFYNQGKCYKGASCPGRHAVDSRTIRDRLGHNVCIFHIIGRCHFSDSARPYGPPTSRCWYSHSLAYLPADGWWNDPERIAFYRATYDILKATGSNAVMDLMLGGDMNGTWLPSERAAKFRAGLATLDSPDAVERALKQQRDEAFSRTARMDMRKGKSGGGDKYAKAMYTPGQIGEDIRRQGMGRYGDDYNDYDDSDEDDYVYAPWGLSQSDIAELAMQGINPWDEDAMSVLAVLNGYY
ncbi:hypothetical protein MKEN_00126100 [Mycena kentingensis (nom. inval.)]|nr:hypothetical protein MKEN_00126100 [Mycena kentingensis (nom. inval.)]